MMGYREQQWRHRLKTAVWLVFLALLLAALPASAQEDPTRPPAEALLVTSPADSQVVYAASGTGFYRSQDGSETWTLLPALPGPASTLQPAHHDPELVYVGLTSGGVVRSFSGGETWQSINDGLGMMPGTNLGISALAVDPNDDAILYAATGYWLGTSTVRFSPVAIQFSADSGAHWLPLAELPLSLNPIRSLEAVAGQTLTVDATAQDGTRQRRTADNATLSIILEATGAPVGRRAAAAQALGLLGDPAAIPALVRTLNTASGSDSPDAVLAGRAAEALGRLQAAEAVPALEQAFLSPDAFATGPAARALARIGTEEALAPLYSSLNSAEMTPTRHAAMSALEELGSQAIPGLLRLAAASGPATQRNAVEMLGWIGDPAALDGLLVALESENPEVRAQAAWSLGELGQPEAREALAQAAASDSNAEVRLHATQALTRLPVAPPPVSVAPPPEAQLPPGELEVTEPARAPGVPASLLPILRWILLGVILGLAILLPWYQNVREERRRRHN